MGDLDDIDEMLRAFLKREKENPLDEIKRRLVNAADWQTEHETKDEARHKELMEFRVSQERRVTRLESDVEHLTKDVDRVEENTGNHNIAEIVTAARGPRSTPPKNGIAKVLGSEIAKHVAKGVALLLVAAFSWCAHDIKVTWGHVAPPASAAPSH